MIDEKKLVEEIEKLPFIHHRYDKKNANPHFISGVESMYEMIMNLINSQPKVGEWIPVEERLPENAKHRGTFCPKYHVKTKFGITEGWYNPDVESWYCLFWFFLGRCDETDIDFEKGDKPKVIRVPDETGIVIAWKEPSEPWEGGRMMIDEKKLINKLIIRREKLRYISIAALHNNMNYVDTVINEINSIIDIINEQPKVGGWIPCSERLPEECGCYLVAWKDSGPCSGFPHYYEIVEYDPDDEDLWIDDIPQARGEYAILAWMPLPEPWKGAERNDTTRSD